MRLLLEKLIVKPSTEVLEWLIHAGQVCLIQLHKKSVTSFRRRTHYLLSLSMIGLHDALHTKLIILCHKIRNYQLALLLVENYLMIIPHSGRKHQQVSSFSKYHYIAQ